MTNAIRESEVSSADVSPPDGRPISRDGAAARRALLICHAYATSGHTGSFRWRSLTRLLVARGWEFDVVANRPPATGDGGGDGDGEVDAVSGLRHSGDVHVHTVSPDWWLWRWRQRRLASHVARERAFAGHEPSIGRPTDDGAGGGGGVDPRDVPVVAPGQRLGVVEHLRKVVTSAADIADAWVWGRRATRLARALAMERGHDLVLATSPETATHDVAARLARDTGTPFVAEFRDPRFFGREADRVRLDRLDRWFARRAELSSLGEAAAIVDITAGAHRQSVRELEREAPAIAATCRVVIPSGYERTVVGAVDATCFRVVYTGWIWPFMPLPALLHAAGRFCRELDAEAGRRVEDVVLELVGVERTFNGVPVDAIAEGAGLDGRFSWSPRLARDKAARVQERGAVLVAFDSVCTGGLCIPSKLYHYAPCRGAILPIGEPTGAMAEEARKIDVETYPPSDVDGIVAFLHRARARWARGGMTTPSDREGVLEFGHRADEMAALLETVRARREADVAATATGIAR